MLRSFLFVPADSARKLEKSVVSAADALILDLEDSVALPNKPAARARAREFLNGERAEKKFFVRVNAFDSGLTLDDLNAVMPGRPDGIVLPKCGGGEDVARLGTYLDAFEVCVGAPVGSTLIIPVATETPQAVLNMASYQSCGPRLWGLMWGAEDLAGAMGASSNRENGRYRSPFRLARDMCLMAASAAGVVAIDAVYVDVKDQDGLVAETSDARMEGFGAKALIHPGQCEPVNQAFLPTSEEIAWAHAVLHALSEAPDGGVATLDGRMVDRPHEIQARRILGV